MAFRRRKKPQVVRGNGTLPKTTSRGLNAKWAAARAKPPTTRQQLKRYRNLIRFVRTSSGKRINAIKKHDLAVELCTIFNKSAGYKLSVEQRKALVNRTRGILMEKMDWTPWDAFRKAVDEQLPDSAIAERVELIERLLKQSRR